MYIIINSCRLCVKVVQETVDAVRVMRGTNSKPVSERVIGQNVNRQRGNKSQESDPALRTAYLLIRRL